MSYIISCISNGIGKVLLQFQIPVVHLGSWRIRIRICIGINQLWKILNIKVKAKIFFVYPIHTSHCRIDGSRCTSNSSSKILGVFSSNRHCQSHCSVFFIRTSRKVCRIIRERISSCIHFFHLRLVSRILLSGTHKCFSTCRFRFWMNPINPKIFIYGIDKLIRSLYEHHTLKIVWSHAKSNGLGWVIHPNSSIRSQLVLLCQFTCQYWETVHIKAFNFPIKGWNRHHNRS